MNIFHKEVYINMQFKWVNLIFHCPPFSTNSSIVHDKKK